MWLKEHYYKVLTRRVSDGCTVFRIVFLSDCEVYRGHFPGHPVCPGAFNIQMVKECAMEVSGKALHIRTIKLCRLTAVVSPCTCTELDVAGSCGRWVGGRGRGSRRGTGVYGI